MAVEGARHVAPALALAPVLALAIAPAPPENLAPHPSNQDSAYGKKEANPYHVPAIRDNQVVTKAEAFTAAEAVFTSQNSTAVTGR